MNAMSALQVSRRPGQPTSLVSLGPRLAIGGPFVVIAGPCALESEAQVQQSMAAVVSAGAHALRGGAFKPRTSPHTFQGLGVEGIALLKSAKQQFKRPIVSEVIDLPSLEALAPVVDLLQIGARNMQNFALLKAVAQAGKPVLLKRGFANTLDEWLLAAEHLLEAGNSQVVLCERGIRSFDTSLRNTLDLAGMALMKQRTHLPMLVDPSHATGDASLVPAMALAAAAAGADGLLVEVHHQPREALCDGPQALTPEAFTALMRAIAPVLAATGRALAPLA